MKRIPFLLTGLALLTTVSACSLFESPPQMLQGQVECKHVNISSKVPGRVEKILVHEGQSVTQGQEVAQLSSDELQAKMAQIDATIAAAKAQSNKAEHGARKEQIAAARANWERAQAGAKLANKTFERVERLYEQGVLPAQKRDEARAQSQASTMLSNAAKAQYDMARAGTRTEDKEAAEALVRKAEAGRQEVEAYLKETKVKSPLSGEIANQIVEEGELVSAGLPILIVADLEDAWVSFQIREDHLAGLTKGTSLTGTIPALGDQKVELTVSYISSMADFATWHSTRASGGYNLKTFEVRARPAQPIDGLRPGMSVLVPMDSLSHATAQ